MFRTTLKVLVAALTALPLAGQAAGVLWSKHGEVQSAGAPVALNQRIAEGAAVSTAPGASAILRFDDGLHIALEENTTLTVLEYRYRDNAPASGDRAAFELQRGAVRVVTGYMAERNPGAFSLGAPQASVTLRESADFVVVLYNPMYLNVASGSIVAANQAGRLALPQGSSISIANAKAVPLTVQPGALPPVASSAMGKLQVAMVQTSGGIAAGAQAGSVAGGAGAGIGLGVSAAAAALAAAARTNRGATSHLAPPTHKK